ncbi:PhzF family phenazine biosynthesis protein [Fodinicola acaciae]|uniref:PhzF family phenazine biosynthesis protein n=1 Tax=Fodinicola acaciae TaxID=2681555 RepID=UPI0013D38BB3|nr:PhzF family phenazine biosynthesis protein [Fodinicola acaciae]
MHPYVITDVFTDTPLEGNPLAVFTAGDRVPEERMQRLAKELNLSETVFVLPAERGGDARIRIFTPAAELPFAGHPTLGTALLLADGRDEITLETGAGDIRITIDAGGEGQMAQPIPTWQAYDQAGELLAALGVGQAELPVEIYQNGPRHVYVALPSADAVAALAPDLTRLGRLGAMGVNCFAGSAQEWKTRVFCPGLGVPEDPATGSAAGPLAVHLARHGRIGFGQRVRISQGAEIGRPSTLYAQVDGSGDDIERVLVSGSAVVVARGEFS